MSSLYTWTTTPALSSSTPLKVKAKLVHLFKPLYKDTEYSKQLFMTMHRSSWEGTSLNSALTNQSNNHPLHHTTTTKIPPNYTSTSLPLWPDASSLYPASIPSPTGPTRINTRLRSKFEPHWQDAVPPMKWHLGNVQMSVTYAFLAVKPWRMLKKGNGQNWTIKSNEQSTWACLRTTQTTPWSSYQ